MGRSGLPATECDVAVIGGGATGCGAAWDLALRGLSVVLAERGGLASGTSGRYHGLLHSGARYAVTDPAAARECAAEGAVLRRVAPRFLDDAGGLFVLLSGDGEDYLRRWTAGCAAAGIPAVEIEAGEALRREPRLSPSLARAFRVLDAVCRSLELCAALAGGARSRGARILAFHRVDGFLMEGGAARGLLMTDMASGAAVRLSCRAVLNAAGPWSGRVAALAGLSLRMSLAQGVMLAFDEGWVRSAVNLLAPPGDGDILLARGRRCIAGTTSRPTEDPDARGAEEGDVRLVRERMGRIFPGLEKAVVRHAWSGVRPLYDPDSGGAGAARDARGVSRDFHVLDHAAAGGVEGVVTVVGGKLTTFRLMAEKAADAVCGKLGCAAPCRTAETEIPAPPLS